ncbi:MAG: hypothetical protein ACI4N3_03895, partial [Alphaproteobacteria bacterium]
GCLKGGDKGRCIGGRGGNGELKEQILVIGSSDELSYTYTIGKGGSGGGASSSACKGNSNWGGDGENSSFKINSISLSVVANGGHGGQSATVGSSSNCISRENQPNTGNGKGASGGDGKRGTDNNGNGGSTGWVKIYRLL